jgi:signal transduction histidine kinase
MAELLANAIGASEARVWLRLGNRFHAQAGWPTGSLATVGDVAMQGAGLPQLPTETAFEVLDRGELLGALTVEMPSNDPMSPVREKLGHDLASQAGLVLRNVRLIEELRASRQRLVAAQDEERRKIERNLHDGAQQQLISLAIKVNLAQSLAEKDGAKTAAMLVDVKTELQDSVETLRDLARGIYPPLLADQGLAIALDAQAKKAALPTTVGATGLGRYTQEIEAAVYFCTLEALQNVAKYANATHAQVHLTANDGHLEFEITDDGAGFDTSSTNYGTGMQGMADRLDAIGGTLTVSSELGRGTTVTGRIAV